MGLKKMMTYLKQRSDEDDTLLLDQGDTWQETIYSNHNRGAMITDVMNYVRFDARTVGNHDFDWGLAPLIANTNRSYDGYSTPVLAANVNSYDPSTRVVGDRLTEIGRDSVTYTLENGLKVGVVGVIGKDQITSISSQLVANVAFTDHVQAIKDEATKLRENGCDLIIAAVHSGQETVTGQYLNRYVDLVLCGHTHREQSTTEYDLLFAQFGSSGETIGNIEIDYDVNTKTVVHTRLKNLDKSDVENAIDGIDPTIENICAPYLAEAEQVANQVVLKSPQGYFSRNAMAMLMTEAIYDAASSEGYDVYCAMTNNARAYISGYSSWIYADVFHCFPFDNQVIIMDADPSELAQQAGSNYIYRPDKYVGQSLSRNNPVRIAVIDYLGLHQSTDRVFNYFPYGAQHCVNVLSKTYREILVDYLAKKGLNASGSLSPSAYNGSGNFSTSILVY